MAREKEGLTYGVYTGLSVSDKTEMIVGGFSSTSGNFNRVMEIFNEEWNKMGAEGVSAEELEEAKNYLRVDYDEDDRLIQNLLLTAKNLVMDVGRMDEDDFTKNEDTVRTAMLFALGYLYENRSNPDYKKMTLNLRSILFAQREGVM